jgi:hypothetical protein
MDDVLSVPKLDERSVMTYISEFVYYFNIMDLNKQARTSKMLTSNQIPSSEVKEEGTQSEAKEEENSTEKPLEKSDSNASVGDRLSVLLDELNYESEDGNESDGFSELIENVDMSKLDQLQAPGNVTIGYNSSLYIY